MKGTFNLKKALIVSLVALGLIVLAVYCVKVTDSRDALRVTLASTQNTLTVAQAELVSVHSELASTQTELTSVKGNLTSAETELASVRGALVSAETELVATKLELVSVHVDLTATQDNLAATEGYLALAESKLAVAHQQLSEVTQELDVAQETLAGLGITISTSDQNYDANLVDNPEAVNPSWDELVSFLVSDQTENNEYISGVYDCSEFSRDVHNNAEAAGIRAAVVHDYLKYSWSDHALNAFLTTDYGLVYVDCTESPDRIAYVVKGERYKSVDVYEILPSDVRNGTWWDALECWEYYYLEGWVCTFYPSCVGAMCAASTGTITIFW